MNSINHLDFTPTERKKLRAVKIKLKEVHHHSVAELQALLDVSKIRAMELSALSEFQSLPQIGIRFAHDLISMGYYSLKELKGKDPAKLLDRFEQQLGAWIDPCLEDQFRLVVHYAQNPREQKNWWDFTPERKAFREKFGYPKSRPTAPWFNLPQYHTAKRIAAAKEVTQNDLHKKLKQAAAFMKKNFANHITLAELSEAAGISRYHFLRSFKHAYEKTPGQFLTRIRLKEASSRLKKTKQDIGQVVVACGFENKSSFIRLFKRTFGVTPLEYRNFQK
ncbi:MAG: helix-hairpin-helix domain-containing protein [Cyclobacteriaceae bacterium]